MKVLSPVESRRSKKLVTRLDEDEEEEDGDESGIEVELEEEEEEDDDENGSEEDDDELVCRLKEKFCCEILAVLFPICESCTADSISVVYEREAEEGVEEEADKEELSEASLKLCGRGGGGGRNNPGNCCVWLSAAIAGDSEWCRIGEFETDLLTCRDGGNINSLKCVDEGSAGKESILLVYATLDCDVVGEIVDFEFEEILTLAVLLLDKTTV